MSRALEPFGDFTEFAPLLVLYDRVFAAGLTFGASLAWLLPDDVLPGVTTAYGLPVERVGAGLPALVLRPAELGAGSSASGV